MADSAYLRAVFSFKKKWDSYLVDVNTCMSRMNQQRKHFVVYTNTLTRAFYLQLTKLFCQAMEEKSGIPLLLSFMCICSEVSCLSSCMESASTVRTVERCPTDSESWGIAAKNMNCDAIKQNCSQSSNRHHFQYHCVINAWMNATFEVCAPNRTIFGYCTEYNVMGRVIQENYNAYCRTLDPPCPFFYNSAEAYKYQGCYQLVKKNHQTIEYSNEDIKKPVVHVKSTSEGLHGDIAVIFLSILHACFL